MELEKASQTAKSRVAGVNGLATKVRETRAASSRGRSLVTRSRRYEYSQMIWRTRYASFWGSELSFDDCMNMDPFSRISPVKQSSKRSVGRFVEGARLLAYVVHLRQLSMTVKCFACAYPLFAFSRIALEGKHCPHAVYCKQWFTWSVGRCQCIVAPRGRIVHLNTQQ